MTPDQRARYRRLAEVELERGNALAAILLDALDEMDRRDSLAVAAVTDPTPQERYIARAQTYPGIRNDPPNPPPPTPTVIPLHDLDYGPGGEIETDLGPDPSFDGRAPMRDAPPTTQS